MSEACASPSSHLTSEADILRARLRGELLNVSPQYRLVDLFSGAGGMTLGFTGAFNHSFNPVWANDQDRAAVATYNENFGDHCVHGDIVELLSRRVEIPPADVVIGGPPCQGFSLLNKNRRDDLRKQLWRPFLEVVGQVGASVFVMENVPQLLGSPEYDQINQAAEELGFKLTSGKLCAADYGVPQTRWRAFVVGWKQGDPSVAFPPKRTHSPPSQLDSLMLEGDAEEMQLWSTVRDAIADLGKPRGTEIQNDDPPYDLHFGRRPTDKSKARYRAIPKEGMNRFDLQERAPELTPKCWVRKRSGGTDLFGRLWWDKPAFTIRTEFFKPEKGRYLHPADHRPITHREAARLQSFPDDFCFVGSKIEIAKQIGNAVPPLLSARVADVVTFLLHQTERLRDG